MPKLPAKKQKSKKSEPVVEFSTVEVRLFHTDPSVMKVWNKDDKAESNPLTVEVAKDLLGWCTEDELRDKQFESLTPEEQKKVKSSKNVSLEEFTPLLNLDGKAIYCFHNNENRPFKPQPANDYELEILRKKWKFNGESIIIDKYGRLHDGQHRLVGLILAAETWKKDAKKAKDEQDYQQFWDEEPYIETVVVLGIDGDDETVNTIGTGVRRSLEDVLYRSVYFEGKSTAEKKALAKVTSWAIKLIWDRTAQKDASYAPRRPHSESMDFIARHEQLLKCVRAIFDGGGDSQKFANLIPLGYAAGLMYLMATATSDVETYGVTNSEASLDFKLWDKAEEFWVDVADNGKATEPLREALLKIPETAGGSFARDLRCGLCIKAWNLYSDGEKITADKIELEVGENEIGQPFIAESPKCGGIDIDYSPPQKEEKPDKVSTPKTKNLPKTSEEPSKEVEPTLDGDCPKGGDHDYITDEDDGAEYCAKCLDPKTVSRSKPKKGKK